MIKKITKKRANLQNWIFFSKDIKRVLILKSLKKGWKGGLEKKPKDFSLVSIFGRKVHSFKLKYHMVKHSDSKTADQSEKFQDFAKIKSELDRG